MAGGEPTVEIDARYGEDGVAPVPWSDARARLENAGVAWLSTVRPDGRPHVTPLVFVWADNAIWFCTGPDERKARNLQTNRHVVCTTGANDLHEGLDVVVEGDAELVTDHDRLGRAAAAYEAKYGDEWHFDVRDGAFHQAGNDGPAVVFAVAPTTIFAFGKAPYSQTRYRFDSARG